MLIEILTVSEPASQPNKAGTGTFLSMEVAYKRGGKVEAKKIVEWKHPKVFAMLKNAKIGDKFEITVGSDPGGFKPWIEAEPADGSDAGTTPRADVPARTSAPRETGAARAAPANTGRVTGSNYETPEERKVKQRYIVRQSNLNTALEMLKHNTAPSKAQISEDAVIAIAKKFEAHVYGDSVSDTDFRYMKSDEV